MSVPSPRPPSAPSRPSRRGTATRATGRGRPVRPGRGRRATGRTVLTVLAVLTVVGALVAPAAPVRAAATDPPGGTGGPGGLVDGPLFVAGARAERRLAGTLEAAARTVHLAGPALRRELAADGTLLVDRSQRLVYREPVPRPVPTATVAGSPLDPPVAPGDVFALHSRPGARRTLYLDLDGATLAGTAWNQATGARPCATGAFSLDADPATFSTAERAVVQDVWRRVAEDYAPFDVDVTTALPAPGVLDRADGTDEVYGATALITNSTTPCAAGRSLYAAVCPGGCGGVAYVGVFALAGAQHAAFQPALVFQNGVGTSAKTLAEAASHELGHNLGLTHDGTATAGYATGQGPWAPIMGVGYYKPVTQWSQGEYQGANNRQDDLAVIAQNGLDRLADDVGDTPATAAALTVPSFTRDQLVGTRTDRDVYRLAVGTGVLAATVTPAPTSPDLDLRLELRDANGTVQAASDPPVQAVGTDLATGLGAALTVSVPAGVYTLTVDGVGFGDPATSGYSDYASLGRYRLTGTAVPPAGGAVDLPPTARLTASALGGVAPFAATFSAATSSDPEGTPLTYRWTFGEPSGAGDGSTGPAAAHVYRSPGVFPVTVTVTDAAGLSASASVTVSVAPARRIDVARTLLAGNAVWQVTWAQGSVVVQDAASGPVANATVTGVWSAGSRRLGTRTAVTNAAGTAQFASGLLRLPPGTPLQLCVTGLAAPGALWEPTLVAPSTVADCATVTPTS